MPSENDTPDPAVPTAVTDPAPAPDPAPAVADAVPAVEPEDAGGEKMFPAAYVTQLRHEAAKHRTELSAALAASEAASKKAAEEAAVRVREEITQNLAKGLGLVAEDVPDDPQQLLDTATAQAREAQAVADTNAAEARKARVELAAFRIADKAGADPDAVLDSRTFLRAVRDLDPADEEFGTKVQAAVEQALEVNPRLRRPEPAPAGPARSGGDLSAGPATKAPVGENATIDELREMRRERRARR